MTSRRLLILGIAAIVAIAAGVWLAGRQGSSGSTADSEALYPGLKEQLNSVSAVRIYKAGDARVVELERQGDSSTVSERDNYPADESKLRKLLIAIADAKLYEEKTSNPGAVCDARRRGHPGQRRDQPAHRAGRHAEAGQSHRRQAGRRGALDLRAPRRRAAELADQYLHRYFGDAGGLAAQGHHRRFRRPHAVGERGNKGSEALQRRQGRARRYQFRRRRIAEGQVS